MGDVTALEDSARTVFFRSAEACTGSSADPISSVPRPSPLAMLFELLGPGKRQAALPAISYQVMVETSVRPVGRSLLRQPLLLANRFVDLLPGVVQHRHLNALKIKVP